MFRRSGADIHSDAFISVAQAILGGTATAQGLYETISILVRCRERCSVTDSHVLFSLCESLSSCGFRFPLVARPMR